MGVVEGEPAPRSEIDVSKLCKMDLTGAVTQRKAAGVLRPLLLRECRPEGQLCSARSSKSGAALVQMVATATSTAQQAGGGKILPEEAGSVARWMPLADAMVHCIAMHRRDGIFAEEDVVKVEVHIAHLNAMTRDSIDAWVQEKRDRVAIRDVFAKHAWAEHRQRVTDYDENMEPTAKAREPSMDGAKTDGNEGEDEDEDDKHMDGAGQTHQERLALGALFAWLGGQRKAAATGRRTAMASALLA